MKTRLKSYKKRLFLVFLMLFSNNISSQNLAQTYAFAQNAHALRNYLVAIENYERIVFFDDADTLRPAVYYSLAQCYFNVKNYPKAADYYDIAYHFAATDSQKTDIILQKLPCLLAQQHHTAALGELYGLSATENLDKKTAKSINFYYGIAHFGMNEFEKSQAFFLQSATDTATKIAIRQLFLQNKNIDKISPKTAQWLSTFVPGLGQLYVGDTKNGINSMALTGLMGVWAVSVARSSTYLDAVFTVFPWFQRYYNGGRERSKIIAEQAIAQRRYQIYVGLLNAIAFDKKQP